MKKLDPRLRYLLRQRTATSAEFAERVGVRHSAQLPNTVGVLVRCLGNSALDELRTAGMRLNFATHSTYTVASGEVTLDALERLGELICVERVEASRPMVEELNISRTETRTHSVHLNTPEYPYVKGAGVIIGIVDGGIDYTHPSFCHEGGSSRILFLWDQGGQFDPNGQVRDGREYTQAELDEALRSSDPFTVVPHQDHSGHGTHVAGIAAGNGRVRNGEFTGIAPDADLIVVAGSRSTKSVLEAFDYIVRRANGRPVAINLSQGSNSGGHSGETVFETGLDNLLRQPNVIAVKSAGNQGNQQEQRIHTGGQISQGETVALEFQVHNNNPEDILEVWYDGADQISVALQPPDSSPLSFVTPVDDGQEFFRTSTGNTITVDFDLVDANDTDDKHATIILSRGDTDFIQPGTWNLLLRGDSVQVGSYDVWIDQIVGNTKFSLACANNERTITIPGNARRIITVGSYVTHPADYYNSPPFGQISSFSSRGPTRYGLQKPEIAAPGEMIISARSTQSRETVPANPDQWHTDMRGTSMAAPHVTGAAALILSVCPNLTCEQVKQILMRTARCDGFASSAPDNTWGSGKLNAEAAIEWLRSDVVHFPQISNVQVNGAMLSWQTDIPTTSAVRFHTHQRRLQLGNHLDRQENSTLHTDHTLTLSGLSPGIYYCEILAFSQHNWWATDDNGGEFYVVHI